MGVALETQDSIEKANKVVGLKIRRLLYPRSGTWPYVVLQRCSNRINYKIGITDACVVVGKPSRQSFRSYSISLKTTVLEVDL